MYECIRMVDKPGAERLKEWFKQVGGNQVRLLHTPMGPAYQAAQKQEEQGHTNSTKNFGEWATSWVMANLEAVAKDLKLNPEQHFGLILSEDKDYLNGEYPHNNVPKNTHFLSTQAFFVALKKFGFIDSAENLRKTIQNNGRPNFPKSLIDKPFKAPGLRTSFETNLKRISDIRSFETRTRPPKDDEPSGGFKP